MSAREIAEDIVGTYMGDAEPWDALAAAIESALLAERERCAKIAEQLATEYKATERVVEFDESKSRYSAMEFAANQIATAIRSDEE